ncbi:MAG: hypothetical protein V3T08_09995 [Gemmatimonadota bacterium]
MIPVPPWWVASIIASLTIAVIEYLNRAGGYATFGEALLRTGPFIIVAQFGLFYAWRDAPSFMFAWAFFVTSNMVVRLASVHFAVGEPLSWMTMLGVSLVFGGIYLIKVAQ